VGTAEEAGAAVRTDVVVIGSGAAGTCAAIETARAGLRTMVLESMPTPGGAGALSGGGCCIAGSPLQERLGIRDSVRLALDDWARWGGPQADLGWARDYLEHAVEDVYAFAERLGVEWVRVTQHEGNTVPRWHAPAGGGERLMELLRAEARTLPISWRMSTPVTRLAVDSAEAGPPRVVGVVVTGRDGGDELVAAESVIVATGGLTGSRRRVDDILGAELPGVRLLHGGAPGAVGTGHDLLAAVGAAMAPLENIWIYPYATVDIRDASGERGLAVRGVVDDIWLNSSGRRFHDESKRGGATGTPALIAQENGTCWSFFDHAAAAGLTLSDPWFGQEGAPDRPRIAQFLEASPYAHVHEDLPALADLCGLPADEVLASVSAWNGWIRSGLPVDPVFGRPLGGAREMTQRPFHAIQFFPMARKSLGGVLTDRSCRVLLASGGQLENVFACGEVAGMAGGHINGAAALEGTMLGPSLYSGRVAGRAAVRNRAASGVR
jgi:predicted oxidoreductase